MSRARDLADAGSKSNFLDNVSADINSTYAPINNPAFTGTFSSEAIIGGFKSMQVFSSAGSHTWTKPSGMVSKSHCYWWRWRWRGTRQY